MVRATKKTPTKFIHKAKPAITEAVYKAFIFETMKETYPDMKLTKEAVNMLTVAAAAAGASSITN
jgi:hypothetical protein